jgi:FkbM family methyltransferase
MIKSYFPLRKFLGAIKNNLKYMRKFAIAIPNSKTILKFTSINYVTKYRWDTFFIKEPETLAWIDKMEDGSTLWDVGANVGIYSIYFLAQNEKGKVVAFEPHPSNIAGLIDNLYENDLLNNRITIVSNPLYSDRSICNFNMNSHIVGDSHHTVSRNTSSFCFQSLTMTLDTPLSYGLPCPDYIKIDVDGNEMDIIKSADSILSNQKLKSILIEIEFGNHDEAASIIDKLNHFGFKEVDRVDTCTRLGKDSSKKIHNVIFDRV